MATIFETHLVPLNEELETQENYLVNYLVVIRSFTLNPKVPFTRELYPIVRKESQESLLDEVESTYAEELNGKDLVYIKLTVNHSKGILTIKYYFE